jgi:K+-sensing histidine kinase KdpD
VVSNLLENNVRPTPGGTNVTVSARAANNEMIVTVADDSPAIDPAVRGDLFAPSAPTPSHTSVGLAICSSILDEPGGTITGGDLPGGGARFRFTLLVKR